MIFSCEIEYNVCKIRGEIMSYFISRGWRWEYQLIQMKYNIMYVYTKGGGGNSYDMLKP